jgi:hypothetical protein
MPVPLVAGEVLSDYLFDTEYLIGEITPQSRRRMFVKPFGVQFMTPEGNRPKDYLETNMPFSGQLDASQKFLVKALRSAFIGPDGIVPVSSLCYADTMLRLVIGAKPYWTGPAWKCADLATLVLNADTLATMRDADRAELLRALGHGFDPQPLIDYQQPFYVEVTFGRCWQSSRFEGRLVVLLEGELARPVV